MNLQEVGLFVAIVSSIAALIISWRKAPAEARHINSQAADTITDAAIQLIQPLKAQIEALEKKGDELEKKIETLQELLVKRDTYIVKLSDDIRRRDLLIEDFTRGIKILIDQLIAAKVTPLWTPNIAIIDVGKK
jgi:peptidoglycan hydrolase CwlO-like protein